MLKIDEERAGFRKIVENACRASSSSSSSSGTSGSVVTPEAGGSKGYSGVPRRVDAGNQKKSYAVVVRASGDTVLDADEVKKRVMSDVQSAAPGLKVNAVRRVRNGVAIEVADNKGLEALKACRKFADVGLKVDEPRKIGPKIIIYDCPEDMSQDALLKELYSKNATEVPAPEFLSRTRVVSLRKGNLILEVSPLTREVQMREGRVFLGWQGCRVREIDLVQRCHRCYAVGHMARECKLKTNACRICSKEGHLAKDCRTKEEVWLKNLQGIRCLRRNVRIT